MFCGKCGKEVNKEAAFCPHCGQPTGGLNNEQAKDNMVSVVDNAVAKIPAPYEYKVVSVAQHFVEEKGKTLEQQVVSYLENNFNKMAKDGWEFYKLENYSAAPLFGCLPALLGRSSGTVEQYKLMIFRRKINK